MGSTRREVVGVPEGGGIREPMLACTRNSSLASVNSVFARTAPRASVRRDGEHPFRQRGAPVRASDLPVVLPCRALYHRNKYFDDSRDWLRVDVYENLRGAVGLIQRPFDQPVLRVVEG
jgi:hypothetical protein